LFLNWRLGWEKMKKIKDFDNHQEKRIQEMRERFVVYNKMKKKKKVIKK
jgi:hypothetical protein